MKIVHLIGWYFPESVGGTEVYVAGLAAQQRALGHSVMVVAPLAGAERVDQYDHQGIEVFRYPIPPHATKREAQGRVEVRGTAHLREYLAAVAPDIAHFHTITTGLGVDEMIAAKQLGARVVMTSHLPATGYICLRGTLMQWGEQMSSGITSPVKCAACALQQRGLPKPLSIAIAALGAIPGASSISAGTKVGTGLGMTDLVRFRMAQQRLMMETVDRFVLLNEASFRIAAENGAPPAKLSLNFLGHSGQSVSRKPAASEKPSQLPLRIGYVGRLGEEKGLDVLIAAIDRLPENLPLRFEIYGRANDSAGAQIARKIQSLCARRNDVQLEPPLSPSDVQSRMASFDVLCVPSKSFENGPTVVSEAHAVGTPVIGTAIGAMREIIPDGIAGLLLPPGDSNALARAFRLIADDPAIIDTWRDNLPPARTMRDVSADYETMYNEILQS